MQKFDDEPSMEFDNINSAYNSIRNEYNISNYSHNPSSYEELERFYSIYNPNEIFIIYNTRCNYFNNKRHEDFKKNYNYC